MGVYNPILSQLHSQTQRYKVGTLHSPLTLNEHGGLQGNRKVEGQE